MKPLRFAPIIRVSTEDQEKRGESLLTQTTQIKSYVEMLNGTIPDACQNYAGQEHASPNHERQKMDQLLQDCGKDLFDAVIVSDTTRWSRDNLKNKEGLKILRDNGIRFFVGTVEYDLFNPEQIFFLGVAAEIGELQARQQSLKSMQNRIHRAKRGIPTAGKVPYGRKWTEEPGWELIPEKKERIEDAARRYLEGESMPKIAKSLGMNHTNLNKILTKNCGTEFPIKFYSKELNIDETVVIKGIPRLLEDDIITRINERKELNKTFNGTRKYWYLLSKFMFCKHCGYSLGGYANHSGRLYYRHATQERKRSCDHKRMIAAVDLETAVLVHLFETFGSIDKIKKAVEDAIPDNTGRKLLERERNQLLKQQEKVNAGVQRLVRSVADGMIDEADIGPARTKLREEAMEIESRLSVITDQLSNIPDPEEVKELSKWASKIRSQVSRSPGVLLRKPYELKRKLIENAFSGTDREGKPLGVYVEITGEHSYQLEIRGTLQQAVLGWEKITEIWGKHIPSKNDYSLY